MARRSGSLALLALLAPASTAGAQDVTLPSGLAARLFDVVLEGAAGPTAPDAFTDPEAGEDAGAPADVPLDADTGAPAPGDAAAGGLARFRLVVPGLGGEGAGYNAVAGDLPWVCEALALPALAANGWRATEVVVTLADREVPFGEADPEATQFIEGFRIEDGACVPQAF